MDDQTFHRTNQAIGTAAVVAVGAASLYFLLSTKKAICRDNDTRFIERVLDSATCMQHAAGVDLDTPTVNRAKAAVAAWEAMKKEMTELASNGKLTSAHICAILDTGIMG